MLLYTIKEDGTFKSVEDLRVDYIQQVLWKNEGDINKTAEQLQVSDGNIEYLIQSNKIKIK